MLAGAELYRHVFLHEIEANHAMLKMLGSVPAENRNDQRFARALGIAAHMVICRNTFLKTMRQRAPLEPAFEENVDFDTLEGRFRGMEAGWTAYLDEIGDAEVDGRFEFEDGGEGWWISREAQLFQLATHAAYHRGQVVLLVDQLGGETFDTDYIEWITANFPDRWGSVSEE